MLSIGFLAIGLIQECWDWFLNENGFILGSADFHFFRAYKRSLEITHSLRNSA